MKFVRVAVNIPAVTGEFDYHLPQELEDLVKIGQLVRVHFGQQMAQGVIVGLLSETQVSHTKPVLDLLDVDPVLTPAQIELAKKLAAHTLNSAAVFLGAMLPPGLSQHADSVFTLKKTLSSDERFTLSRTQERLINLLENRGALRGRQIDRHFSHVDWHQSMQVLLRNGIVQKQSILPPPTVRPKYIITAQLAVTPEVAITAMPSLGKTQSTLIRRQKALQFLLNEPEPVSVAWVYAESGCNLADLQELAEKQLILLLECEIFRDPLDRMKIETKSQDIELTREQLVVLSRINIAISQRQTTINYDNAPYLLHGVTGSGKTEIYLHAAAETIKSGKSVIILVPEIALTPQIVRRFATFFPGQVGLMHSKLSDGERYDTWRRARSGSIKVLVGPRSALFAPFLDVGLIVVDECHDNSYYQSEQPFYHTVWAAEEYAKICNAICIFGSATPPVELKYRSESTTLGDGNLLHSLELKKRIPNKQKDDTFLELPPIAIVDMRDELKSGNRSIFSRSLHEALAEVLERGEQAILYLNRRGTSTYVFCRDCGYALKCPRCDIPLIFHAGSDDHADQLLSSNSRHHSGLRCHQCNYSRDMIDKCPACHGRKLRAYGLGSEKVESEAKNLFPDARVLRWDWETTREKNANEMILTHFSNRQADILVGTQMLAKGLDFPYVTLVGIVLADVGLGLPDPLAGERVFQLLNQVSGRAGRSELGGKVIMQTYMPENPIIQMAGSHDYDSFYHWELKNRLRLGYPPYFKITRLVYMHRDSDESKKQANELALLLRRISQAEWRSTIEVIGPAPCFFQKVDGYYRWQIILRGTNPVLILHGRVPEGWRVEVEPASLL